MHLLLNRVFMGIASSYLSIAVPVATAIIAGAVTLVVTVLSKEQKTSEFRQAWIDSLRSDVSELAGVLENIVDIVESQIEAGTADGDKFIHDKSQEVTRIQICITRIRLRLNPGEHKHILEPLMRLRDSEIDQSFSEVLTDLELVVAGIQALLKGEWERVKLGEPAYRQLKRIASRVVTGGTVAASIGVFVWLAQELMPYVPEIKLQLLSFL
jgi:hypothetical protein